MMNPKSVLDEAKAIISERGEDYDAIGSFEQNFDRISRLACIATGMNISGYEVALIMVCLKLARIRQSPRKRDSYIDAIAYLAFAAELIEAE
jgi:hypothetical protein